MPHRHHIYTTVYEMAMATMCTYPPSQHVLPHWKCVLHCFSNFPCIDLPDQESDMHHSNGPPSILFHIYHLIARCIVYGRHPIHERKMCCLCYRDMATVTSVKLYTRRELVMMEISIADLHTSLYIP